ncbi:hypothetical protein [Pedobacter alpinus]|uniref:Uncharacterized protein n=1 Tax=Pedobacter alpinus TaxID=1590643 RepID=A0ABW5TTV3_9SPHI
MKAKQILSIGLFIFCACNYSKTENSSDTTTINIFHDIPKKYKTSDSIIKFKGHVFLKADSLITAELVEYDLGNNGEKEIIVAYTIDLIEANVIVFNGNDFKKIAETKGSTDIKLIDGNIVFERYHVDNTEQNIYSLKGKELVWIDEKAIEIK